MKKNKQSTWITLYKTVHHIPGRVRWKFNLTNEYECDLNCIENLIRTLPGVKDVRINTVINSLAVSFNKEAATADELKSSIETFSKEKVEKKQAVNCETSDDISLSRVFFSLGLLLAGGLVPLPLRLLATLAAAFPVFNNARKDLFEKGISSHILETMAIVVSLVQKDFVAASTTIFMIELGVHLENSIVRKSDSLIKTMLNPLGDTVWVFREGKEVKVSINEVTVGETVIVGTGTIIPVDGTVLDGNATVNESSMTGESLPVLKERGNSVMSGTYVEEGRIKIYAEHVGDNTAAARIADFIEKSLEIKSHTQVEASNLADRLVPYVLALAGGGFILTGDTRRLSAVLQADYSCALKLATPVAFKSAMYTSGRTGILVKGSSALEKLAEADTFLFDKTGTLTEGNLQVSDSVVFDSAYTPDDLIALAASVEEHYFHPLALAIVAAAKNIENYHFDHSEVSYIVSHGVVSEIKGKRIIVGSRHFLEAHEKISVSEHDKEIDRLSREGKIILYIGYAGHLIGIIGLKDTIRSNSQDTIKKLRALGAKKIYLLTGDNKVKGEELAKKLTLDGCFSKLLPEDKIKIIKKLEAKGAKIAFIGDGINDAPALTKAGVGISMHNSADISRFTSDISLMEDNIMKIAEVKSIANTTMQLIKSNYWMTIILNSTILGTALFGGITPITASILHNGTTIGILLRSLIGKKKENFKKNKSPV